MKHNELLTKDVTGFLDDNWLKLETVIDAIKEDLSLSIMGTSPDETTKREELYYTAKAADALMLKLQALKNEAVDFKDKQGALTNV